MIVTNPSPAARFRSVAETVRKHRELVGNPQFEMACDFAMLNYQARVIKDAKPDGNGAASGYYRLLGAQEFLAELRLLAESPTQTSPARDVDNLRS